VSCVVAGANRQRKGNSSACRKTKRSRRETPPLPLAASKALCITPAPAQYADVGALRQLTERSATFFVGHAARAAALAHNQAHFSEHSLSEYTNIERICRALALRFASQLSAQRQWGAALLSVCNCLGDYDASALTVLPYTEAEAPADGALHVMNATMKTAHRLWRANQQRTLSECANTMTPSLLLAFDEYKSALDAAFSFIAHAELLLARLRMESSAREFAAAAEAVVAECEAFATNVADAVAERARWSTEVLNDGVATHRMQFHDGHQVSAFFAAAMVDIIGGRDYDPRCCAAPAPRLAGSSILVELPCLVAPEHA
jgi:hypothetical protein